MDILTLILFVKCFFLKYNQIQTFMGNQNQQKDRRDFFGSLFEE